jgi:cytochrome c oxidase subunit 1
MQRRLYDPSVYEFLRPLLPLNQLISRAAFVLGAAQLIFVGNFFWSLARGRRAPENPWQVGTLEWSISSPPPHHNFDAIPVVNHGPHELGNPLVLARLGRDWLGQTEAAELAWPARAAPEDPAAGEAVEPADVAGAPAAPEGTT